MSRSVHFVPEMGLMMLPRAIMRASVWQDRHHEVPVLRSGFAYSHVVLDSWESYKLLPVAAFVT